MSDELYKEFRPASFKHVIGQPEAVKILQGFLDDGSMPHALLFTGPSGCGKTTLARILQKELECSDQDFDEKNAANFRGIDTVREIAQRMHLHPIGGKVRIYLIDECHQLTKDAQNMLLKMLEDTPKHVYFMLATTDPVKVLPTINTRCTEIRVKPMKPDALREVLVDIADVVRFDLSKDVCDKLIEHSEASARKALVLLNAILSIKDRAEQMKSIEDNDHRAAAIQIARLLMNPKTPWSEVAALIKTCDEEPEAIRRLVLGYASSILLNSSNERAFFLMDVFSRNFYDSGRAGLVLACYAVLKDRR